MSLAEERARAEPSGKTASEWQRLRSLLLGSEQASLQALAAKVGSRDNLARSVASVLAEATAIRARQDDGITRVLAPIINDGLQQSVRNNPQPVVDALYPIMGPAIRRSIGEALADMVQTFNRALEQSLSPRALKWRLDGWRTGQPYAHIVLLHTLVYRVEQVFLIHRETGLLLGHAQAAGAVIQDPDMVSGMLTAIRDFVGDSFHVSQEDGVDTIRVGELAVQVRVGPKAILAAVVRGNAPQSLRTRLSETLEGIHRSHAIALSRFDGDMAPFATLSRDLEPCLLAQARDRTRKPWRAYLGLTLLLVAGAGWLIARHQTSARWNAILAVLEHEPGFVVVETTTPGGAHVVRGLRDPLARDPQRVIGAERARGLDILWDLKPYLSMEPQLILERARSNLKPPEGVVLRLDGPILRATGIAPAAWVREARRRAPLVAGITTFDDRGLDIKDRDALNRARQALSEAILYFEPASDTLSAAQLEKLDELVPSLIALRDGAAAEVAYSVDVVGRADAPGGSDFNLRLSQSRAEAVRRYLLAHGVPARLLHARGIGAVDAGGPQGSEADDAQRRVSFELIAAPPEPAEPAL